MTGYSFSESDWIAVAHGIGGTDAEAGPWLGGGESLSEKLGDVGAGEAVASGAGREAAASAAENGSGIASVDTPSGLRRRTPLLGRWLPGARRSRGAAISCRYYREEPGSGKPVLGDGTPRYAFGCAARYGITPDNVANCDFIEQGRLVEGSPFVTRAAPAVGTNPGGGIEVVVPPGGVDLNWFSVFEAKGL
jgi:hypothetical protein